MEILEHVEVSMRLPSFAYSRVSSVLVGLLVATGGCGGGAALVGARIESRAQASPEEVLRRQVREVVRLTVRVRGLVEKQPVRVEMLEKEQFSRALTGHLARSAVLSGREPAPELASSGEEVSKLVLGFYDWQRRVVVVQHPPPSWAKEADVWATLAHEVTHALQDQHFGLRELLLREPSEETLAVKALIEGDAQLVASGVQAVREGRSASRAMERAYSDLDAIPYDVQARSGLAAPEVLELDPLLRAVLLFQYLDGAALAAALYRTGGFALLDQAFAHPPRTTQQVLHPEKYLEGALPAEVGLPEPPLGFVAEEGPDMGELFARELLRAAAGVEAADRMALRWLGGRTIRLLGKRRQTGSGWLSVWQSAHEARSVEALLRKRKQALSAFIKRSGTSVVMLSGLSPKVASRFAAAWFAKVGKASLAPPPFARVELRAPPLSVSERVELRGALKGARYASSYLGVAARVPDGWLATTAEGQAELVIRQGRASGSFVFIDDAMSASGAEQLHRVVVESLVQYIEPPERPERVAANDVALLLGAGTEWVWRLRGIGMSVRTTLIPACGGLGTWMLLEAWQRAEQAKQLGDWRRSFELVDAAASPACLELKRAERE